MKSALAAIDTGAKPYAVQEPGVWRDDALKKRGA